MTLAARTISIYFSFSLTMGNQYFKNNHIFFCFRFLNELCVPAALRIDAPDVSTTHFRDD